MKLAKGKEKLSQDLAILEAMAAEMEDYLKSEVLFWRMMKGNMPMLTLGGYLMREHRLLELRHLLDEEEQARLDAAVKQFNQALVERVVRFEQKAHQELEARIRQWGEYLRDLHGDAKAAAVNYETAVENRAMITAVIDKLQMAPYRLEPRVLEQVDLLDRNLRRRWQPGDFIWPEEWLPAYPQTEYWWLYGRPK
ncbi:MAG TPA: hypothetical protein VF177_23110 [Anaerolineae bacterium]